MEKMELEAALVDLKYPSENIGRNSMVPLPAEEQVRADALREAARAQEQAIIEAKIKQREGETLPGHEIVMAKSSLMHAYRAGGLETQGCVFRPEQLAEGFMCRVDDALDKVYGKPQYRSSFFSGAGQNR